MADREIELIAKLAPGIAGIDPRLWDGLAAGDPFLSHAFLAALEESGSVGPGTGWSPAPIIIEDQSGTLRAAAPAYLKSHSQGEYVFDHGWADAWERAGGQYYPKLQVAVPFTPVPGSRLLGGYPQQLLGAIEAVTQQNELSSAHITFVDEAGAAECERRGWLIRHGIQYHWHNRGYSSFDDFLGALTSRKRKAIRKERAAAREGLEFRALRGDEIGAAEWDAMWAFYQDTGGRKWGRPYLTRSLLRPGRREHERSAAVVPRLIATAGRSPAHSISSAARHYSADIGARSKRCRSSISSSAIIRRSNGRSSRGCRRSRLARRANINWRAATSR